MKAKYLLLTAFILVHLIAQANNDSLIVASQLKDVTVYKSGAEMTHTTTAILKQGNNELIINNISNQIDINSVQVKTESAVTIMGIEFSNNYLITAEKSPHIKYLEDSIEQLRKKVADIDLLRNNTSELMNVLKSNRDIKGTQTGLSVAELIKLMDYYKAKSLELQTEQAKLDDKKFKLLEDEEKIQNQIEEEQKKNTSTAGRLTLQLSSVVAGKYSFIISYITPNAFWLAFYDVRVENIKSPMKIVYKAKVSQTTGIDWKQVKLSLSTGLPSQWGNAPEFKTWFLSYINPVAVMDKEMDEVVVVGYQSKKDEDFTGAVSKTNNYKNVPVQSAAEALQGRVAGVQVTTDEGMPGSNAAINIRGGYSINNQLPLYIVNGKEMSTQDFNKINSEAIKSINVLKDASATSIYGARAAGGVIMVTLKDGLEDYISVSDNALDVSFDIDLPYDVPTNGKAQTAILKTLEIPAIYQHYAAPKLDKDPYLLAQIPGYEKLNLLPGEANIIVENTYIGKSFIDPTTTTDTLNLTLGRDKRVAVKREKITDFSSVKFMGANKLQKFTYEITVKNNKNDSVNLLLKDQFPISTDKEIEVQLLESTNADTNNETGLLSWKLALAPGESKKIRFAYSIKYPKNKNVQ